MLSLQFVEYGNPQQAKTISKQLVVRSQAAKSHWAIGAQERAFKKARLLKKRRLFRETMCSDNDYDVRLKDELSKSIKKYLTKSTLLVPLSAARTDPFHTYPVPWESYFPAVIDHYISDMAVDIAELDGPGNKGLLRTVWFPEVLSSPALFSTIVLLAATHLYSLQKTQHFASSLLNIKQQAIKEINEDLANSSKALSNASIGAVAKMASYEAMYGSVDEFNIHMIGLKSMVAMRGGLFSLGLDGLLRRILLWIDINSAFLNKTSRHFEGEMIEIDGVNTEPNPGQFIGE